MLKLNKRYKIFKFDFFVDEVIEITDDAYD